MLPFGVTIPTTVPQTSEIPEGLTNYPVLKWISRVICDVTERTELAQDRVQFQAFQNVLTALPISKIGWVNAQPGSYWVLNKIPARFISSIKYRAEKTVCQWHFLVHVNCFYNDGIRSVKLVPRLFRVHWNTPLTVCICTVHLTRSFNRQTNTCTLSIFIY